MKGIDVSKWQGHIDWSKVKASGVDFAMIKAARGSNKGTYTADHNFKVNIVGAHAAGIKVGVYLYSYGLSVSAVRGEAEYLLKLIEPYREKITYPVVYDLEDTTQRNLGRPTLSLMAKTFCDIIRADGYIPMLYTNPDWIKNRVDIPAGVDLWLAHWGVSAPAHACAIWQHSDRGRVPGITGDVDLNIGYKDYAAKPVRPPTLPDPPVDYGASVWAKDAWAHAVKLGVVDGTNPQGAATREQLMVILDRLGLLEELR